MISPVESWTAQATGLGQGLAADPLLAWQLERARKSLLYAKDNSRFYGERLKGVDVESIDSISDLAGIPFTTARDISENPAGFLCLSPNAVARITTLLSSGSTGNPKRIFFSENDLRRTVDFFACGMSTLVKPGHHAVILMSTPKPNGIGDLLKRGLSRIGVSSCICGNVRDTSAALGAAARADCLVGVPAELNYLCLTDSSIRPKSVLLSADYVPESIVHNIESTWHTHVYTHYGMTETGFGGGVQCCAKEGYHMRHAELLIEIIDPLTDSVLPPGELGEVVFTTLQNEAMPLIRYRTGDVARINVGSCPCGGRLPRLGKVLGRVSNLPQYTAVRTVNVHDLDEVFFSIPGVKNYEVKMGRNNHLAIRVDAVPTLDKSLLNGVVKTATGEGVPFCIEFDTVPPFLGGAKRRVF